jgi:hypothetical protein
MVTTHSFLESYELHLKRCYTATSLHSPIKDLLLLADDENYFVWDLVAENPNCPRYFKRYIAIKKYLMEL